MTISDSIIARLEQLEAEVKYLRRLHGLRQRTYSSSSYRSTISSSNQTLLAQQVTGCVKWFNVKLGYGFITRDDNGQDVFLYWRGILKNNPKKLQASVGDGEPLEFDVVHIPGRSPEAINVTGPHGATVLGSHHARDLCFEEGECDIEPDQHDLSTHTDDDSAPDVDSASDDGNNNASEIESDSENYTDSCSDYDGESSDIHNNSSEDECCFDFCYHHTCSNLQSDAALIEPSFLIELKDTNVLHHEPEDQPSQCDSEEIDTTDFEVPQLSTPMEASDGSTEPEEHSNGEHDRYQQCDFHSSQTFGPILPLFSPT